MENKMTAVEWLALEINRRGPIDNNPPKWLQELYDKAKTMEKEQIVNAHNSGKNILPPNENGEQYYNETYNNGNTNL